MEFPQNEASIQAESAMAAQEKAEGPLAGFHVLDIADEKGSFCSKLLADIGACVVKVEKPGGDQSRRLGPFWSKSPHPEKSLWFWYNNTGKLSITLDLESQEGRNTFLSLADSFDAVVEAFYPGYLERLGLDYNVLSRRNPRLILASITGFGQDGPYRMYKSCDLVASAMGGQMYVCGNSDAAPLRPYGEQSYYVASLFATAGVLLALRERRSSGRGQQVDVSLQEAVAATLEHVMVRYFYENTIPGRRGNLHWANSSCLLPCKDGYVFLTFSREWETLIGLLDSEGLAVDLKDERFLDESYRSRHVEHVREVLAIWTRAHTTSELFELGQLMRFPWAPLCSVEDVFKSPQLKARGFFVPVEHAWARRSFEYPGVPYKFGDLNQIAVRRPPRTGEHNSVVAREGLQVPAELAGTLPAGDTRGAALKGIRVLDFTWLLAGPYCTRLLADFGAEVIKVQSRKTATGAEANSTGYFNMWNRNKLGITLDMDCPDGRELALKLVRKSDVVISNFTPRVMANWQMNYEVLRETNPGLVVVSMSGMGQTGPWKDFVALGPTIQALSGITHLTSSGQGLSPGIGYAYSDAVAGLFAVLACLSGLEYRAWTGRGRHIDMSEYEAMCSLLGPALLDYSVNGVVAGPQGNGPGQVSAAPHGCYRCFGNDRSCAIAVFTEEEWRALCQVMGSPDWAKQEKFSTFVRRRNHANELDRLLERWTLRYTPEEVMAMLQGAGVSSGVVCNAADLACNPHLKSRGFFIRLHHPEMGETSFDGTPIRLSATPAHFLRAAPLLGQDNLYVYRELLGLSNEELDRYVRKGVLT